MAANPNLLRLFRKTHLYFGLFISPALLFFAFTGAVQTLSLHEAAGADYKPPALLASLGQLHKKQTYLIPPRRSPGPGGPDAAHAEGDRSDHRHGSNQGAPAGVLPGNAAAVTPAQAPAPPVTLAGKQKQHLPMKIFFLLVSLGLFTSTITGIYMAYKYERGRMLVTALLLAGLVVPILLARF